MLQHLASSSVGLLLVATPLVVGCGGDESGGGGGGTGSTADTDFVGDYPG